LPPQAGGNKRFGGISELSCLKVGLDRGMIRPQAFKIIVVVAFLDLPGHRHARRAEAAVEALRTVP